MNLGPIAQFRYETKFLEILRISWTKNDILYFLNDQNHHCTIFATKWFSIVRFQKTVRLLKTSTKTSWRTDIRFGMHMHILHITRNAKSKDKFTLPYQVIIYTHYEHSKTDHLCIFAIFCIDLFLLYHLC